MMKKFPGAAAVVMASMAAFAQWSLPADLVPAYHPAPPAKASDMGPILTGKQLTGDNFRYAWQVAAYRDAARIPKVIYQLPCYCHCDRAMGHQSLHSCFEGLHGAECSTCSKEAIFAYQQTMQGKTPQQIRAAIINGEYRAVDLDSVHAAAK